MISKLNQLGFDVEKNPTYLGYVQLSNEVDAIKVGADTNTFRVGVLRNFTVEPLIPVLKGEFYLSGFNADFYIGNFDTIVSDAMNPTSELYSFDPKLIIVAQWFELLAPSIVYSFINLSKKERENILARIIQDLKSVIINIRKNSAAPVIINNFPAPDKTTLGILDLHSKHSQKRWFSKLNEYLQDLCEEIDNVFCVDLNTLISQVGYNIGFNQRQWEVAKIPLGPKLIIPLAKEYGKFVRALNGKTRKCLVLDCDNTLWGGILGEDGLTGIKLGPTYPGSSYQNFQKQILNLYHRGVILAICSKNNEEDVLDVLENHEHMILKKHHFACLMINWENKASNIAKIAKELNIGLDSLVFADDNEFECDWIKSELPDVKTLHMTGDPALFQNILINPGFFDSLFFSEEDKSKTEMYLSEKKRNELLVSTSSYEEYLNGLQIRAFIEKAQSQDLERVAQLTQKTNQFNLTTIRYTVDNIKQLVSSEDSDIYTLKVSDKVSDLGLIAVGIIKYEGDTTVIDSFLMSCRALGRGLEDALLAFMIKEAGRNNKNKIKGRYVPTKKNIQTQEFYNKNKFKLLSTSDDYTEWEFDLNEIEIVAYPEWVNVNSN
jgi:FkbH-like protein